MSSVNYTVAEINDISGVNQLIYECPANTTAIITSCIISNRSTSTAYTLDSMSFDSVNGAPTGYFYFYNLNVATDSTNVLAEAEGQIIQAGFRWEVSATTPSEVSIRATIKEIVG